MNSLSTFTIILVLGAIVLVNVSGLPNRGAYYGNSVEGGSPSPHNPTICARSEVFSRCNAQRMCQKTCDNYNRPIACTNNCEPGCICKEGFVRVIAGDQCIPIDKCEGRVKH